MLALTSSACLDLWEQGWRLHSLDRGLLALSFSLPTVSPEEFADWPLGRRNQALLELYRCFASRFEGWTSCEQCGEKMEFSLDVRDFLPESTRVTPSSVTVGLREFRLPSSRDLAAIAVENDSRTAASRLIERCLKDDDPMAFTASEILEIEERMAAADPLAELRLALSCPSCSFTWEESLDVITFLWAEIELRGKRLLEEVHTLARAYGWTQSEILSLTNFRRSLYLQMNAPIDQGWAVTTPGRLR